MDDIRLKLAEKTEQQADIALRQARHCQLTVAGALDTEHLQAGSVPIRAGSFGRTDQHHILVSGEVVRHFVRDATRSAPKTRPEQRDNDYFHSRYQIKDVR